MILNFKCHERIDANAIIASFGLKNIVGSYDVINSVANLDGTKHVFSHFSLQHTFNIKSIFITNMLVVLVPIKLRDPLSLNLF